MSAITTKKEENNLVIALIFCYRTQKIFLGWITFLMENYRTQNPKNVIFLSNIAPKYPTHYSFFKNKKSQIPYLIFLIVQFCFLGFQIDNILAKYNLQTNRTTWKSKTGTNGLSWANQFGVIFGGGFAPGGGLPLRLRKISRHTLVGPGRFIESLCSSYQIAIQKDWRVPKIPMSKRGLQLVLQENLRDIPKRNVESYSKKEI